MSCLGCWYFEPIGGNLGYCEIQDQMGCDKWEPDKKEGANANQNTR